MPVDHVTFRLDVTIGSPLLIAVLAQVAFFRFTDSTLNGRRCHLLCRRVLPPVLDDLASELTDAKIVKVNVDQNPGLAAQYRISSIRSLLVFKDGEVVRRHVGLADNAQLKSLIEL